MMFDPIDRVAGHGGADARFARDMAERPPMRLPIAKFSELARHRHADAGVFRWPESPGTDGHSE
jgi:hypothetical protein